MNKYVLGFAMKPDNTSLLAKKNRPARQKGLLNGIGGNVLVDESSLDAMRREAEEEVGFGELDWPQFADGTLQYEASLNGLMQRNSTYTAIDCVAAEHLIDEYGAKRLT